MILWPKKGWVAARSWQLQSQTDHAFVQIFCLDIRFVNVARIWGLQIQNGSTIC